MSRALAEIDFFTMGNARHLRECSLEDRFDGPPASDLLDRRRRSTNPSSGEPDRLPPSPSIPAIDPSYRPFAKAETVTGSVTAPLTVCFNGTVAVFELSHDKADAVMRLGKESAVIRSVNSSGDELLATVNQGLLPLARKKSLQRCKDDDKKFIQEGSRGKKWWVLLRR